jgi:hypothetical protein
VSVERIHDVLFHFFQECHEAIADAPSAQPLERRLGPAPLLALVIAARELAEDALRAAGLVVLVVAQAVGLSARAETKETALLFEEIPLGLVVGLEACEHPGFSLQVRATKRDTESPVVKTEAPSLIPTIATRVALVVGIPYKEHNVDGLGRFADVSRNQERRLRGEKPRCTRAPLEACMGESDAPVSGFVPIAVQVEERLIAATDPRT